MNNFSKASGIPSSLIREREGERRKESESESERVTARNVCAAVAFFPVFIVSAVPLV